MSSYCSDEGIGLPRQGDDNVVDLTENLEWDWKKIEVRILKFVH